MSERTHYPAGVPCWVETLQPDPAAAQRFYGELFGWTFAGPGTMPGDPPGQYFVAQHRGCDVAGIGSFPAHNAPSVPVWMTYIRVERADAAAAHITRAGGSILVAPFDAPPAGRMAVGADPLGVSFCIWEAGAREGAQRVNEPCAWAISTLMTSDLERSATFYGAVFGWQTDAFGDVTILRLPGYVGGEPEQPVPRDTVAVMMRVPVEPPIPPHWHTDFWVADTDAAVATTQRMGGRVLVPAYQAFVFKQAVLADPAGAVFTISQLLRA
jgi:predicted enzyme related to lactoylglutathione lyase